MDAVGTIIIGILRVLELGDLRHVDKIIVLRGGRRDQGVGALPFR